MAILIDPKGLLWGKRLRRLSNKARLFYPLILGLSNFYARIELDETCILSNFSSFKDPDLTAENLTIWVNEYANAGLAYLYHPTATQIWVQFDTPLSMRREYPTSEDNQSPAPPLAEYSAWLQSLHGDTWKLYDLCGYQQTISEKRAEAGRKGGAASGEARRSKANASSASEGVVGDGEGGVVGEVEVEVEGVVCTNTTAKEQNVIHRSALTKSNSTQNGKTETTGEEATPETLAECFHVVVQSNPKYDAAKLPKKWKALWAEDFAILLQSHDSATVYELIAASQTPSQAQYNVRPEVLIKNAEILFRLIEKLKKARAWSTVWNEFCRKVAATPSSVIPPQEQIEFPDEGKSPGSGVYGCPYCTFRNADLQRLHDHALTHCKEHSPGRICCPLCYDNFPANEVLWHTCQTTEGGTTFNIEDEDDELA